MCRVKCRVLTRSSKADQIELSCDEQLWSLLETYFFFTGEVIKLLFGGISFVVIWGD